MKCTHCGGTGKEPESKPKCFRGSEKGGKRCPHCKSLNTVYFPGAMCDDRGRCLDCKQFFRGL